MRTRAVQLALVLSCIVAFPVLGKETALPAEFQGVWAEDLGDCSQTGENERVSIEGNIILRYETGWTIKRWHRKNEAWIGTGTLDDDQGSEPATVTLRLRPDGGLLLNEAVYSRCPAAAVHAQ